MRTMYIILSWVGWGWAALVLPAMWVAIRRRRRRDYGGGGFPVQLSPAMPVDAEVQSRP